MTEMQSPSEPSLPDLGVPQSPLSPTPTPPPASNSSIGHFAIRGMAWIVAQSIGTKCITMIQQILIARLFLNDEDFGLLAVAQVVISFASIEQSIGVGEMLVRRHRAFDRWVDAGFWLNLTGGLAGMLLVLGIIPVWRPVFLGVSRVFGGHVTQAPDIRGLLAIWSLWLPLDAMTVVINARLRTQMRFRLLATLGTIQVAGLAVLSLVLAALGCRAYSLVIPIPFLAAITLTIGWTRSRQRIRARLNLRRWIVMLRDSRFFLVGTYFNILLQQGDYMLTSVFFSRGLLGAYYFAYRMSTQSVQLVGANMTSVLLPSFSKLDDNEHRRTIAYERTCAALLLIGMPLCFLQAVVAEPVFHLLFGQKWNVSLPMFEVLSVAMGFTLPMTAATSLLMAQGRYRLNATWLVSMALCFLTTVLMGALRGSVYHVAWFVSAFFTIVGPLTVVLPVWRAGGRGGGLGFLWRVYAFPALAGAAAAAAGWGMSAILPWQSIAPHILVRTAVCLAVFSACVMLVKPRSATDLIARLRMILAARRTAP